MVGRILNHCAWIVIVRFELTRRFRNYSRRQKRGPAARAAALLLRARLVLLKLARRIMAAGVAGPTARGLAGADGGVTVTVAGERQEPHPVERERGDAFLPIDSCHVEATLPALGYHLQWDDAAPPPAPLAPARLRRETDAAAKHVRLRRRRRQQWTLVAARRWACLGWTCRGDVTGLIARARRAS